MTDLEMIDQRSMRSDRDRERIRTLNNREWFLSHFDSSNKNGMKYCDWINKSELEREEIRKSSVENLRNDRSQVTL